jgi:hypothetical protein
LSATRKKDGVLNPSDPNAPIVISFRAIHRELHYLVLDASWETNSVQRLFIASLEEWQRQVVGLGHAWRCHLEDDAGNTVTPITRELALLLHDL